MRSETDVEAAINAVRATSTPSYLDDLLDRVYVDDVVISAQ